MAPRAKSMTPGNRPEGSLRQRLRLRTRKLPSGRKRPFDIDVALERVRRAIVPFAQAALFELADERFSTPFEQLVACIVSQRTFDEVTIAASRRLFARARTPRRVEALGAEAVAALIRPCSFAEPKAARIVEIARRVREEFGGELPCEEEALLSLRGVGPKTANLVLGIACGRPRIGVDTHVHRVTNRWGYVAASTPEKTLEALVRILPRRHWVEINRLLVPFGKHVCTARLPKCSSCPVLDMCRQVGVTTQR